MRSYPILLLVLTIQSANAADAPSLQLNGTVGFLHEWELSGKINVIAADRSGEYSGAMSMKHIGLCSQSGPQEKTADLKLQIKRGFVRSTLSASLVLDGATCRFEGPASETFNGFLDCPTAKVPLKFSIQ